MASADPLQASSAAPAATEAYLQPSGPSVPRSHSFLPLRCGPPIYFPLPAPYDEYCLTGVLPSDSTSGEKLSSNGDEENGDVEMTNGEPEGSSSRIDGVRRVKDLDQVQDSGGWEYPIIRRAAEIKALTADPSSTPAIIGTFSFGPSVSASSSSETTWSLGDVWIMPEERQNGLATLVITYILHSWFLRLPGPRPSVTASAESADTPSQAFLKRLGFRPKGGEPGGVIPNGGGEVQYTWTR